MGFNIQTDGLHIPIQTSNTNYDMLTLFRMLYISIYNRIFVYYRYRNEDWSRIFTYYRNEDLIKGRR